MVGTRSAAADAAWSTPAIIAETISFGPEVLLIAAVALLVAVAAMVAYLVGGYVAIWRVAAGSRSPGAVVMAALAVLVGAYLVVVPVINSGEPSVGGLVPPAVHGVAAWRGRRHAERARSEVPPPPPPPPTAPPTRPPSPPAR